MLGASYEFVPSAALFGSPIGQGHESFLFGSLRKNAFLQEHEKTLCSSGTTMISPIIQAHWTTMFQWLKDHPGVRFYVNGYASVTGDIVVQSRAQQGRRRGLGQAGSGKPRHSRKIAIVGAAGWGRVVSRLARTIPRECRGPGTSSFALLTQAQVGDSPSNDSTRKYL